VDEKASAILEHSTGALEEAFNCAKRGSGEYRQKLLDIARSRPEQINFASSGQGSVGHLATELETSGLSLAEHLEALTRYLPGLRADVVLADGEVVGDPWPVRHAAESLGARLVLAPMAAGDGSPRHDPSALAAALSPVLA